MACAGSGSPTVIASLPYTDSQTATTTGCWYVYTAPTPVDPNVLGLFVYTADTVAGQPAVTSTLFSPDTVTNTDYTNIRNKAFQVPMTAGVSYYLKVRAVTGSHAYTLSVLAAPSAVAPAGSLWVNDDTLRHPLALISSTDATPLRFVTPFPNGENADVIASGAFTGSVLVHNRFNDSGSASDHLLLYDSQMTLLADLSYGATTGDRYPIRTNKALSTTFYVGKPTDAAHGNKATVTTVTTAGAFGPTTWVLPAAGLMAIAPSRDETVLYFTGQTSTVNSPIARWDLVNNVA